MSSITRLTSIIIPTFNGLELLRSCVEHIRTYTDTAYEIIVVDNGSRDGTCEYCLQEGLFLISLPQNLGFPAACNYGLRAARGDSLLLLNNDVLVSPRWLSLLTQALYSRPEYGIAGPVTNYASGIQQVKVSYKNREGFLVEAERHNRSNPARWREVQRIVGLCFLFKREVAQSIGLLDEGFSPGHYEDDDYCYRARKKGYRLILAGDVLVHHEGSASFRRRYPRGMRALIARNRKRFIQKWGCDPRTFIT
ncbi:glycosyltransferase family 2 protein [Paenibacillus sp. F411]|uniref:Glycosyl transferase family protein n=1 Tax=Paenibacillus algicola TaxID=2565926 RepID=A0A4P8XK02_9BACL|nr:MULTISPECIES: glycosyltransferase family 2 protein [Paenibacillus]MBO2944000.1 glycosyltransferase family 2 protein [Paenibacillus sp. F411]QCT01900.1 glycosyl transferase family protein [Paenibacillus algicola]